MPRFPPSASVRVGVLGLLLGLTGPLLAGCGGDAEVLAPEGGGGPEVVLRTVLASDVVGAPDSQTQAAFEDLRCADPPSDPPDAPTVVCGLGGEKYDLDASPLDGLRVLQVDTAVSGRGSGGTVSITLTPSDALTALTRRLARTGQQLAVVRDDVVVAAVPVRRETGDDGELALGRLDAEAIRLLGG